MLEPRIDPQLIKQRREELLREAEMDRLARALRAADNRRAHVKRVSALAWEWKRIAGRLLKIMKASKHTE